MLQVRRCAVESADFPSSHVTIWFEDAVVCFQLLRISPACRDFTAAQDRVPTDAGELSINRCCPPSAAVSHPSPSHPEWHLCRSLSPLLSELFFSSCWTCSNRSFIHRVRLSSSSDSHFEAKTIVRLLPASWGLIFAASLLASCAYDTIFAI